MLDIETCLNIMVTVQAFSAVFLYYVIITFAKTADKIADNVAFIAKRMEQ